MLTLWLAQFYRDRFSSQLNIVNKIFEREQVDAFRVNWQKAMGKFWQLNWTLFMFSDVRYYEVNESFVQHFALISFYNIIRIIIQLEYYMADTI